MAYISPSEVATYRALQKTAIVLMIMFRLDKPTCETEIAEILNLHPATVRTHLRSLKALGLVTRTHRYQGWMLTQGGRQMLLGEPVDQLGQIKTSAKNSRSPTLAAAAFNSLSLIKASNGRQQQLEEKTEKRARKIRVQNESQIKTSAKFSRSRFKRKYPRQKKTGVGASPTTHKHRSKLVRANLETLQTLGLGGSRLVSTVCRMDHVTPNYILGQKNRLEAEGRYSPGLLLKVIRDEDSLAEKYIPKVQKNDPLPEPELLEIGEEADPLPDPDPSVFDPVTPGGITAARAWDRARSQLQRDLPKASYDTWVSHSQLIGYLDGTFVIAASTGYARDWLESRLTSTVTRLLTGICNRSIAIKFVTAVEVYDLVQ